MATGGRFVAPYYVPVDLNGNVSPGAKLFFFGSGTSTPLNTFSDVDLTSVNTNPVIANGAGQFPSIFLTSARYKVELRLADNTLVWTADPVLAGNDGTGSTFENVAALLAYNGPAGSLGLITAGGIAVLTGYYTRGDEGGGQIFWDPASVETHDGGLIFKPTSLTALQAGRWKRLTTGDTWYAKQFGAKGIGASFDDTVFVQAVVDRQKANGGDIEFGNGTFNITSTISYIQVTPATGLTLRGNGTAKTSIRYGFATGLPLLKIRGTVAAQFMTGGSIADMSIDTDRTVFTTFMSQGAAVDMGNWVDFSIERVFVKGIRGHGFAAPSQNVSVNNNTNGGALGVGVDLTNEKPWAYVDRGVKTGRMAQLHARVDPATGAITGFRVYRSGSGYTNGASIRVKGPGTGFAGTITTSGTTTATTTNGSMVLTVVGSILNVQAGQFITGAGIPAGTSVSSAVGTTITINQAATASAAGVTVTLTPPGGGVFGYSISAAGTGYYETNDHLFDGPDPYSTALFRISQCRIEDIDGVGMLFPHFATGNSVIQNNYVIVCRFGGLVIGGNNVVIQGNSIAFNGMNEDEFGFWPGIWLRRTETNCQDVLISNNEFDSNTYCHILLDGTNSVQILPNRFNSWVTLWNNSLSSWTEQIPNTMIRFDIGNGRVTNNTATIIDPIFRSQNPGAGVPTRGGISITSGTSLITGLTSTPVGGQGFKVGGRVEVLTSAGAVITWNAGALVETTILAIGATTLTVAATADTTVSGGTVRVIINAEHCTGVDLGRNGNTGGVYIRNPINATGLTTFAPVASLRSTDGDSGHVEWTEGGERRRGLPGLNCAMSRIAAAAVVSIPVTPSTLQFPWNIALDPEGVLETSAPGVYTGKYLLRGTGIYEMSGAISIDTPVAGDIVTLESVINFDTIATTGVITTNTAQVRRMTHRLEGFDQETITFVLSTAHTIMDTYIGTARPSQNPTSSEDGLVWFDPAAETYQRWNGTTLVWEAVTGSYTTPFLINAKLFMRASKTGGASILVDTTDGNLNWCNFRRTG